MDLTPAAGWAVAHPWPATVTAGALAAGLILAAWRLGHAVLIAALAAMACTAYSADTSWGFAKHRLGMTDDTERLAMFAAAEIALIACGLLARANKAATATEEDAGTAGVPGVLVWVITGVQVIPAYSESGFVGGTVRAIIGPVMAGLLWHQAMGLEIRVIRPGALSTGLPALIAREVRERLLSWLGLAVRDRSAEQITRDRWTARAVEYAVRLERRQDRGWGWVTGRIERRLSRAIGRSGVASSPNQRAELIRQLSARRNSAGLATIQLTSPWDAPPPPVRPRTPAAVARQPLTQMHPYDALMQVHRAHPQLDAPALAALLTSHGVITSEANVRRTLERAPGQLAPTAVPDAPAPAPALAPAPRDALVLDIVTEPEVHPEMRAPAPAFAADQRRDAVHVYLPKYAPADAPEEHETPPADEPEPIPDAHPEPEPECTNGEPEPEAHPDADALPAELVEQARALGRPAPLRTLQKTLRIGQKRAQLLQQLTKGD
ncbi:hypothetical protein ACIPXV_02885 [Streptomyces libani]|uniref:hypothetical protein n=1 Tax=Streptomyces nigrescens TaxID=1920 RepID=UPI0038295C3E